MENPPVIIIGMHRSGTSMVIKMLEKLGLFVGKQKDLNHEALFFQKINDWIMHQCGTRWDNPTLIRYLLNNDDIRKLSKDYISFIMKTPHAISYLGLKGYIRYRTPANLPIPWGWKDPRNTFTLPIWIDLFPDSKVIHIYRHGVDVANSLKVRQDKVLQEEKAIYNKRKPFYFLLPKRSGFTDTVRCTSMEGGFSLWEEYMQEAKKNVNNLQNRAIEIKYEDFLDQPEGNLKTLAQFCNLNADESRISEIAHQINRERAYAYRASKKLKTFADSVISRLSENGYYE
ncbi:MAG: Sulfotransferase domain superfamily protein [Candidatus Magasanikbacteria bacterium GW2011_GWC2_37_14]|uniref:Sulfotransferase domain superfamily protein n=1 Tax=Candidatus Magasanikbacteria bacterium GW2011_GWC2_37_14 TaxID=1619046 RepID=A0A0G0GL50_9BACT|nr:MAG: Sulfotransferase domain superfamily protein [Candidatus Magasanikbacteria bacterium GW2011_GWC2_37_14]